MINVLFVEICKNINTSELVHTLHSVAVDLLVPIKFIDINKHQFVRLHSYSKAQDIYASNIIVVTRPIRSLLILM